MSNSNTIDDYDPEWLEGIESGDDVFLAIDLDKVTVQHERAKLASKGECMEGSSNAASLSNGTVKRQRIDSGKVNCTSNVVHNNLAPSTSTSKISRKQSRSNEAPLYRLRFGRIWVTHIVAQAWCEQQMAYDLDPPDAVLQGELVIVEPPEVKVGKSIHLARELEVEEVVKVNIRTKEDHFAVKVINLMGVVFDLLTGGSKLRREIPIFGAPFDLGIFIIGVIDEIRSNDSDALDLEIVEFKTRRVKSLPRSAQTRTHRLQVMLYKRMFDELIMGAVSKEIITKHMNLNMAKVLGREVLGLVADKSILTLGHLLDKLFALMKGVPFVTKLSIEYAYQADSSTIGVFDVKYVDQWLNMRLNYFSEYWKGGRTAVGVDIEDVWKCETCPYYDICRWRADKLKQIEDNYRSNNAQNSAPVLPTIDKKECNNAVNKCASEKEAEMEIINETKPILNSELDTFIIEKTKI